eukprot:6416924-Prymnesium_polylepis.1
MALDMSDFRGGFTRLQLGCQDGDIERVRLLLSAGASPDIARAGDLQLGCSALYIACSHGKASCVQLLLGARASTDLSNDDGDTPLHVACEYKQPKIVRLLLDAGGADAGVQSRKEKMPIHKACYVGSLACVKMLLSALDGRPMCSRQAKLQEPEDRLLINEESVDGHTPLTLASHEGHIDVVKSLCSRRMQTCCIASNQHVSKRGKPGTTKSSGSSSKPPPFGWPPRREGQPKQGEA